MQGLLGQVDAVLLTHSHCDAMLGLNDLREVRSIYWHGNGIPFLLEEVGVSENKLWFLSISFFFLVLEMRWCSSLPYSSSVGPLEPQLRFADLRGLPGDSLKRTVAIVLSCFLSAQVQNAKLEESGQWSTPTTIPVFGMKETLDEVGLEQKK